MNTESKEIIKHTTTDGRIIDIPLTVTTKQLTTEEYQKKIAQFEQFNGQFYPELNNKHWIFDETTDKDTGVTTITVATLYQSQTESKRNSTEAK